MLFNVQIAEDFPDSFLIIDFNLNSIRVRKEVMYDSNSFKSVKLSLIAEDEDYLGQYPMHTWKRCTLLLAECALCAS